MRVMVTGGAGYIGAHTARLLAGRGDYVLIADDLITGSIDRVRGLPFVQLDLADAASRESLAEAMRAHRIDSVIHFAARKQVGESVQKPAWYYWENVGGLAQLLMAMEDAGVGKLVFSSSAAVYGSANGAIDESCGTRPVSPYGSTKLVGEKLIEEATAAWSLSASSLRYFNVGGAGSPELGDREALNLIPIVLKDLAEGRAPVIFGDDYDTPDGTCVRDYVHVLDVAEAHLAVLDSLGVEPGHSVFNIGTGVGTSVRDMVDRIIESSGFDVAPEVRSRRSGDAPAVVAIVDRIREQTGWTAKRGLDEIVRSAWESGQFFAIDGGVERA